MRKLAQSGVSVIIVTHHLPDILPEIGRVIALKQGQIFCDGSKETVLTAGRMKDLFATQVHVEQWDGYYHMWPGD